MNFVESASSMVENTFKSVPKDEENNTNEKEVQEAKTINKCCMHTTNIFSTVLFYLMSIMLIIGSIFFHPKTYEAQPDREPLLFWFVGVALYVATTVIDLVKVIRNKGPLISP